MGHDGFRRWLTHVASPALPRGCCLLLSNAKEGLGQGEKGDTPVCLIHCKRLLRHGKPFDAGFPSVSKRKSLGRYLVDTRQAIFPRRQIGIPHRINLLNKQYYPKIALTSSLARKWTKKICPSLISFSAVANDTDTTWPGSTESRGSTVTSHQLILRAFTTTLRPQQASPL